MHPITGAVFLRLFCFAMNFIEMHLQMWYTNFTENAFAVKLFIGH